MIRAKLKDNTGASITYALLLFLVCAVVGSVVLAAGTAAAGRMSQSVETDQRYYAVSSAASVLKKELDNKDASVGFTVNAEGVRSFSSFKGSRSTFSDSIPASLNMSITDYASAVATGIMSAGTQPVVLDLVLPNKNPNITAKVAVTVTPPSDSNDPVLQLDVYNESTDSEPTYKLRLVFHAGIDEIRGKKRDSEGNEITTVTDKITWSFYKISTMAAE